MVTGGSGASSTSAPAPLPGDDERALASTSTAAAGERGSAAGSLVGFTIAAGVLGALIVRARRSRRRRTVP
jgi:hypothetical protein